MTVILRPSSESRLAAPEAGIFCDLSPAAPHYAPPMLPAITPPLQHNAPYVLGLYSSGGGGHISALDSIEASLQSVIDVRRVAPLRDILHRLDPIARLSHRRVDGEHLFNALAARGHTGLLGMLEKMGTRRVRTHRKPMADLLREAMAPNPPALIVSTMPFVNAAVSDVAHAMGIPFIIVPTDYDLTNFVAGLPNPLPPMQYVVHAFASQAAQFPGVHLGYPLRAPMARPITAARYHAAREKQAIANDTQVIVVTVGSAGGVRALDIAARLASEGAGKRYHIIVCCGRNKALLQQAQALHFDNVTIEARGYTTDMAGLLAEADVLVTKPGGGTVMEALALGVPMVLDHVTRCVPWERANLTLAQQHGAWVLEDSELTSAVVDAALARPRAFGAASPFPDFAFGFRAWVDALLGAQA